MLAEDQDSSEDTFSESLPPTLSGPHSRPSADHGPGSGTLLRR